jgi:CRP-like cAMP-binding protein
MRLRKTDDLLEDVCFLNISTRLARRLVELAANYGHQKEGEDTVQIDLRLTQKDLASMVGVTRESIHKEMRVLRERNLISTRENMIQILNLTRLKRRARL